MLRTVLVCVCLMLLVFTPILAQDGALEVTELSTFETMPSRDFMGIGLVAAWSPDSSMIAVANTDHFVEIWDAESGERVALLETPFAAGLAFSPSGQFLAVGGPITLVMRVDQILEWGTLSQDDFGPASQEGLFQAIIPVEGRGRFASVAFATDSIFFTYQVFPFSTLLWDISETMDIPDLSSPGAIEPPPSAELALPDSAFLDSYSLVSRSDGLYGTLIERNDDGRQISIQQLVADFDSGTASLEPVGVPVAYTSDEPPLTSISPDLSTLRTIQAGAVQVYDAETGDQTAAMVNEAQTLPLINPGGTLVLETSTESSPGVTLLSMETGTLLTSLSFDVPLLRNGLIFSPDGSRLMAITVRGDVQILELSGDAAGIQVTSLAQAEPIPSEADTSSTGCEVDVSETISLLESAQEAADSGDADEAIALMTEARTSLAALEAQCAVVEAPQTELSQSITLDTEFGELMIDYPGDWLTQEFDENGIVLGNRESAFELDLRTSTPSPVEPGNILMLVGAVDLDYYGQSDLGKNATAAHVLEVLAESSQGAFTTDGDPIESVINDRPAASLVMRGDGLALNFMLVKLATGNDSPIFGQVVLITAPDELDDYEPVQLAVASSLRLR